MAIRLFTGVPGAGKSLCLVDEACKLREREPDRPFFNCGIDDLRPDVATPIDSVKDWRDLPDGSVVLVDEAWRQFPPHPPGRQPDEWILALAEHRHRGFDFFVATQSPTQIAKFVRDLVEQHTHLVRKFGTNNVQRITWESAHTDVKSLSAVKQAQVKLWRYPKERFHLYKSATMHTVKRRVPKRVFVALGLLLLLPLFGWIGWRSLHHLASMDAVADAASVPAAAASSGQGAATLAARGEVVTPAQWMHQRLPRVRGVPWSAPMWDDLRATTVPDLLCVEYESDDRDSVLCSCYTEQATLLPRVPGRVCRQAAEHGVYNPYRPGRQDDYAEERTASRDAPADRAAVSSRRRRSVTSVGSVGIPAPAGQRPSSMRAPYVPPVSTQGFPIQSLPAGPDTWHSRGSGRR